MSEPTYYPISQLSSMSKDVLLFTIQSIVPTLRQLGVSKNYLNALRVIVTTERLRAEYDNGLRASLWQELHERIQEAWTIAGVRNG